MTIKKRRIILLLCALVFLALAGGVILYSQGYILDSSFRFSQTGGIYISVPFSGSEIFVNDKKESTTGLLNNGLFLSNLKTGRYSILVAKEKFWPWAKNLNVEKGLVAEAMAIMLPENPQGDILLKGKFIDIFSLPDGGLIALSEPKNGLNYLTFYAPATDTFLTESSELTKKLLTYDGEISNIVYNNNFLSFQSDKGFVSVFFSFSGNTVTADYTTARYASDLEKYDKKKEEKIWWDPKTNEIFVDWLKEKTPPPYYICGGNKECQLPISIFKSQFPIRQIDFFPGRKDVIIVAVGNGIYALEIDGRDNRLIYPIYKGRMPNFAVTPGENNFIYILDGGVLIKIYLK